MPDRRDELCSALSKEERPFAHPRYWASFILHGAALEA